MNVSINNWHTAGGKLAEIQEACEAFIRGDQPEKVDHLTFEQIMELYKTATAIVDFCASSLEGQVRRLEFRDYQTYMYARSYVRTLSSVLLRRIELSPEVMVELQQWLDRLPTMPTLRIQYV